MSVLEGSYCHLRWKEEEVLICSGFNEGGAQLGPDFTFYTDSVLLQTLHILLYCFAPFKMYLFIKVWDWSWLEIYAFSKSWRKTYLLLRRDLCSDYCFYYYYFYYTLKVHLEQCWLRCPSVSVTLPVAKMWESKAGWDPRPQMLMLALFHTTYKYLMVVFVRDTLCSRKKNLY